MLSMISEQHSHFTSVSVCCLGYVPDTDSYEAIDRLKYGVSGGRLNTVDELLTTPEAALGFAQSSGYGYDAARNLTSDSGEVTY